MLVNNNDSLLTDNCIEINKSNDSITEHNSIEKESINTNKLNKRSQLNFKVSKIETIATKPADFGTFLNNFWDVISSPFKPVWGTYEEDDYNKEGPYFLFMHSSGGATYISKQMDRVRERIRVVGSSEQLIYGKIFDEAGTSTIDNCNSNEGICASAARAKASAFVYLVGLNSTGGYLTNTEREGYRDMI